uniref:Putative replicase n=1 Tax=Funsystermes virus TaxID=2796591 RepID=A0A7T7K8Z4_9VIRU|nr:putative replicase [Funsystermes virus]
MKSAKDVMLCDVKVPFRGPNETEFRRSMLATLNTVGLDFTNQVIEEVRSEVTRSIELFSKRFYSELVARKPHNCKVFHDNCKDRSYDLTRLRQDLLKRNPESEILVVTKTAEIEPRNLAYLRSKFAIVSTNTDELDDLYDEVIHYSGHIEPKLYSTLMVGMIRCYGILSDLEREITDTTYRICQQIVLCLETAGRVYTYLQPTSREIKQVINDFITQAEAPSELDLTSDIYKDFLQVLSDIDEGKLPYIQDIRRGLDALPKDWRAFATEEQMYFSAKASSSEFNFRFGKRRHNKCAFIKSTVERNRHLNDAICTEFLNFDLGYNLEPLPGLREVGCKTIAIEQAKWDPRIIHVEENATQDLCSIPHRGAMRMLRAMKCDCTHEQFEGVLFAQQITSRVYLEKNGRPGIYANDISQATNTIKRQIGHLLVRRWFPAEVADFWEKVNSERAIAVFPDGSEKPYIQRTGQRQGLLFSFPEFALCHHVMTLVAIRRVGMTHVYAPSIYRLLGDDHLMSSTRGHIDRRLYDAYLESIAWIGWKTNYKSLINHPGSASYLVEFAKVMVTDGEILSPPPIRLASRCEAGRNRRETMFSLLFWMAKAEYPVKQSIKSLIKKTYPDEKSQQFVDCLIFGGIVSQFQTLTESERFPDQILRLKALMAYLIVKIKGSFVEIFMSDKAKEEFHLGNFETLDKAIEVLVPRDLDKYKDLIERPDEHKFVRFINQNLRIQESLARIIGLSEDQSPLTGLMVLSDQEQEAINYIAELYEAILNGFLEGLALERALKAVRGIDSLQRFEFRSLRRQSMREYKFVHEAQRLAYRLFTPDNQEAVAR